VAFAKNTSAKVKEKATVSRTPSADDWLADSKIIALEMIK
jgi:hypothetical protein